jgi:hypothetical protein
LYPASLIGPPYVAPIVRQGPASAGAASGSAAGASVGASTGASTGAATSLGAQADKTSAVIIITARNRFCFLFILFSFDYFSAGIT